MEASQIESLRRERLTAEHVNTTLAGILGLIELLAKEHPEGVDALISELYADLARLRRDAVPSGAGSAQSPSLDAETPGRAFEAGSAERVGAEHDVERIIEQVRLLVEQRDSARRETPQSVKNMSALVDELRGAKETLKKELVHADGQRLHLLEERDHVREKLCSALEYGRDHTAPLANLVTELVEQRNTFWDGYRRYKNSGDSPPANRDAQPEGGS